MEQMAKDSEQALDKLGVDRRVAPGSRVAGGLYAVCEIAREIDKSYEDFGFDEPNSCTD